MKLVDGIYKWKYKAITTRETGYEHMIDTLNIISVEDFKKLTKAQQQPYVQEVIRRIRTVNIYPIYYFNKRGVQDEIVKCAYAETTFEGDVLTEHGRAGLILLDFLFPNLHLAEAGNSKHNNMYSRFYDDVKLAKCIHRHMKNYPFTSMRTPFFMYGRFFWNTPTNFSPMRAKAIYERFCKHGDVVYDFSAGYGGRMLGALSAVPLMLTYIGCEPNLNTVYNLITLGEHIEELTGRRNSYMIYSTGSERLKLAKKSVDFAFSCPPYFTLERYSKESSQSTVMYPVYENWLEGYVRKTLANIYDALKPGGLLGFVMAGHIYYLNKKYAIASDWVRIAEECGFVLQKTYGIKTMSRKEIANSDDLYIFKKGV